MVSLNTEICVCNGLNLQDIAKCIQENNFNNLDEILANQECPIGDKCESCKDEGYNNDGLNIPMVLKMVQTNRLPKS